MSWEPFVLVFVVIGALLAKKLMGGRKDASS